jgi:ribulose 1,5-bisphosphate synthetase/thiazole synthase
VKLALGTQTSGVYSWTPVTSVYSTIPPESIDFRTSLAVDATGQPAITVRLGSARDLLYLHQAP